MEVRVRSLIRLAVLGLVAGCSCNGKEPVDGEIADFAVEVLPMPTAVEVTWTTSEEGTGYVEYGIGDAFDRVSAETTSGTDHAVTLVLLKANTTYQVRAVTELADGTRLESEPIDVAISPPPQGMPRLTLAVDDPSVSELSQGYMLTTFLGTTSFVGIADGDGTWVWWAEMDATDLSSARARLSRDGKSVLYNLYQTNRADDQGWLVRLSLDGREEVRTRTLLSHHDFVELPEGNVAWLGFDMRDVDVEGVPSDTAIPVTGPYPIATDVVFEAVEGLGEGEEPTTVWGFFDEFAAEPWWVCSHMEDLEHSFVPDHYEWTHSNSLAYVEEDDSYYVLSRYLDALLKIDRATGSLVWQLGGEHATMTFAAGEPFNHPHVSDVWDGGMLLFDNRDHAGAPSRVVEVVWNESVGTAEVVWEYPRPDGDMLPILGDARRLPDGNRLIVWSARGEMVELTPDGEIVYEATVGLGSIMTRVIYFTDGDVGVL